MAMYLFMKSTDLCKYNKERQEMMENFNFNERVIAMQHELFCFAYKLTADYDSAKDLLQECNLKAFSNQEKLVVKDNFRAWMYTIMRNIFINDFRKSAYKVMLTTPEYDNYLKETLASPDAHFYDTVYDLKELYCVIGSVPAEYRKPFYLFAAGFKYREIADKMGLPIGTIKSRLHFIRQKLQVRLKDFA